jgi:hypothetical protein
MQTLSACGTNKKAIGPQYDGSGPGIFSPFTAALIRQLKVGSRRREGLFATELLRNITHDPKLENQTPHIFQERGHGFSILLKPLYEKTSLLSPKLPPPIIEGLGDLGDLEMSMSPEPNLMALVAIKFRGEVLPDRNAFVYWLSNLYPVEVSGVQVQSITLEGSFTSNSTLMLPVLFHDRRDKMQYWTFL